MTLIWEFRPDSCCTFDQLFILGRSINPIPPPSSFPQSTTTVDTMDRGFQQPQSYQPPPPMAPRQQPQQQLPPHMQKPIQVSEKAKKGHKRPFISTFLYKCDQEKGPIFRHLAICLVTMLFRHPPPEKVQLSDIGLANQPPGPA